MAGPAQPEKRAYRRADDGRRGPSAIDCALIAIIVAALAFCLATASSKVMKSPLKMLNDAIAAPEADD
ncbi:MAG: hypothetical protein JNJ73_02490 [Hyphomonadaceae bacterium]|nr:hypothetical protein [Hyphomonadaceae bacterium]